MKKLILPVILLLSGWSSHAQFSVGSDETFQIEKTEIKASDIEAALGDAGIHIFRFRLPVDSIRPCNVFMMYDEYRDGQLVDSSKRNMGQNIRETLNCQGEVCTPELIYSEYVRVFINQRNTMGRSTIGMALEGHGVTSTGSYYKDYRTEMPYGAITFEAQPFGESKKIPLVFYGSYWKDENGIISFFHFPPSVGLEDGDESIAKCPHYFIISVELTPVG